MAQNTRLLVYSALLALIYSLPCIESVGLLHRMRHCCAHIIRGMQWKHNNKNTNGSDLFWKMNRDTMTLFGIYTGLDFLQNNYAATIRAKTYPDASDSLKKSLTTALTQAALQPEQLTIKQDDANTNNGRALLNNTICVSAKHDLLATHLAKHEIGHIHHNHIATLAATLIALPSLSYYSMKKLFSSATSTLLTRLYIRNPLLWLATLCSTTAAQTYISILAHYSIRRATERQADAFAIKTADHAAELCAAAINYSDDIDEEQSQWTATQPAAQERTETMLNAAYTKAHQDYFERHTIDTAEYNRLVRMIAQQRAELRSNNRIAS